MPGDNELANLQLGPITMILDPAPSTVPAVGRSAGKVTQWRAST